MAQALFQVMLVHVLGMYITIAVAVGTICGFCVKEDSMLTRVVPIVVCLSSLTTLSFILRFIIQGWTVDDNGAGIDEFHEFCTEDDLGDWAHGMFMFYTVLMSILGGLVALALCCVAFSLFCGDFLNLRMPA